MDVEGVGGKLSLERDGGRDLAHIFVMVGSSRSTPRVSLGSLRLGDST